MTSHPIPSTGLIVVRALLDGPRSQGILRLAVDTGASRTVVDASALENLGCEAGVPDERIAMTTGSGMIFVPIVNVPLFEALGHARRHFKVLSHTLPASARIDGLLGLDFLRDSQVVIDFRKGRLTLD